MSRLADPSRDELDAYGQQIWDQLSGPRKGLHGPYLMLMHVPELAAHVGQLGGYLRFNGSLPGAVRELAVLSTARALNVPFEWVMHHPVAVQEGVPAQSIELIRTGKFDQLQGREKLVAAIAVGISRDRQLSDELFQQGLREFGEPQLVELITLATFYNMIAGVINCFQVSLPAGATNPFDDEEPGS